jgi:hypothetical protein
MSLTAAPSAASNTIRARCARPARNDGARSHDSSISRSRGDTPTLTVNGTHHDPRSNHSSRIDREPRDGAWVLETTGSVPALTAGFGAGPLVAAPRPRGGGRDLRGPRDRVPLQPVAALGHPSVAGLLPWASANRMTLDLLPDVLDGAGPRPAR